MSKWAIITVTRNSSHILPKFIDAHLKFTSRDTCFYIIDNKSAHIPVFDLIVGQLENQFIAHKEYRDYNYLFTDSTNLGLKLAYEDKNFHFDYFCIMNPDIIVTRNWQEQATVDIEKIDNTGIMGFKLVKSDGILEHAGALNDGEHRGRGEINSGEIYNKTEEFEWVTFACVVIKREVIEKVGFLNSEDYPHFSSDREYSKRVKDMGYKVIYSPTTLTHLYGKSARPYVLADDLPPQLECCKEKIWAKLS